VFFAPSADQVWFGLQGKFYMLGWKNYPGNLPLTELKSRNCRISFLGTHNKTASVAVAFAIRFIPRRAADTAPATPADILA
jgi:hypothetical protein